MASARTVADAELILSGLPPQLCRRADPAVAGRLRSVIGRRTPGLGPCRTRSGSRKQKGIGMESHIWGLEPTRRDFMLSSVAFAGALSLPAGLLAVRQAIAAGEVKDVPRNRTLVTVRGGTDGKHTEAELWSPYVIGSNPQLGGNIIYEPLAFYSAFADKTIMWLAESYKYSPDYKELTVKTRSGITWSDGKPFSAEDVAYSLNTLNELGGKVKWGKDVQEVLESATVVDPNTTLIKFKVPAPRFFFHMLSYKYDIGAGTLNLISVVLG